jgi:hypothetical protein
MDSQRSERTQRHSQTTSAPSVTTQHASFAAERAGLMFGCFPRGQANDPEIYTMAIAAVLAEYPREVILAVTDPRSGLPRKVKWLPSVAELAEACDAEKRYQDAKRFVESRQLKIEKRVDDIERTAESDALMAAKFRELLASLKGKH